MPLGPYSGLPLPGCRRIPGPPVNGSHREPRFDGCEGREPCAQIVPDSQPAFASARGVHSASSNSGSGESAYLETG
jgi:hypothetical protein